MSLQWGLSREVPSDTAEIGQKILVRENIYRRIGDLFDQLFPQEQMFAAIYAPGGRGAIPPLLLSIVTILQILEQVPDRVAAEYVVSRIDWKYALHLPLGYSGFHYTDLSAFRTRLITHQWERKVFDELLEQFKALGLIRARGKMRSDSTHVLGVVEHLSRLELILESIRVALRAATAKDPAWVEQLAWGFRETYQERVSVYRWSEAKLHQGLRQAGQDGFWFLEQVERTAPKAVQSLEEVATLRQVLAQQYPQGPSQPPTEPPKIPDQVISPHEAEARHGVKRGKGWSGYKAQATESCDEDLPHLVADLEPVAANEQDGEALPDIQQRLVERDISPADHYGDQAYISGEHLAQSMKADIRLMGPPPQDTSGPKGFQQSDFQIDEAARQVTCPAGERSTLWSERRSDPDHPEPIKIRFVGQTCQACQFFGQCTSSPQGRSLELHPYRNLLIHYRQLAQTEDFQRDCQRRNGIEATLSQLVRMFGLRHARYRGSPKLRLQFSFTAAAIDLIRIFRWWDALESAAFSAA